MPKELIRDVAGGFDVRVGWQPDSYVQVGVELSGDEVILERLYGNRDVLREVGRTMLDAIVKLDPLPLTTDEQVDAACDATGRAVLEAVAAAGSEEFKGLWSTLDRDGCNRLIKVLRRARDSAFGRDE